MNRCATPCQRRQRKRPLHSRPRPAEPCIRPPGGQVEAIATEGRIREQTGVDGAETESYLESLAGNDIHRLVRVTAYTGLVHPRSLVRWQHPTIPGPSRW